MFLRTLATLITTSLYCFRSLGWVIGFPLNFLASRLSSYSLSFSPSSTYSLLWPYDELLICTTPGNSVLHRWLRASARAHTFPSDDWLCAGRTAVALAARLAACSKLSVCGSLVFSQYVPSCMCAASSSTRGACCPALCSRPLGCLTALPAGHLCLLSTVSWGMSCGMRYIHTLHIPLCLPLFRREIMRGGLHNSQRTVQQHDRFPQVVMCTLLLHVGMSAHDSSWVAIVYSFG